MTARIVVASGLEEKAPAAFVLEIEGRRILLDLGQGSLAGVRPSADAIGIVDALVLSHAHKDHCGALDMLPAIGDPPVYASASVLARLGLTAGLELPVKGEVSICSVEVVTGRAGHALGSVWIRLGGEQGVLYMGDATEESEAFAFDPPPAAETVILDASYGPAEETRGPQLTRIAALLHEGPLHCPVPPDGRGIELALAFAARGHAVALDEEVRGMLFRLGGPDSACARTGISEAARHLAQTAPDAGLDSPGLILSADATGDKGTSARLIDAQGSRADRPRLAFTGHLAPSTRGHRLVAEGKALKLRWNVHPTFGQNRKTARQARAERCVLAFAPAGNAGGWRNAFPVRETLRPATPASRGAAGP